VEPKDLFVKPNKTNPKKVWGNWKKKKEWKGLERDPLEKSRDWKKPTKKRKQAVGKKVWGKGRLEGKTLEGKNRSPHFLGGELDGMGGGCGVERRSRGKKTSLKPRKE